MCGCPARRIDHTRLQLGQLEEVAPVERKRVDLLATDHGGYLMMVLVQTGHDALDDNGFVHIADLQCHIDRRRGSRLDGDGPFER